MNQKFNITAFDLEKIIHTVKSTQGFDFSHYASDSLKRRIARFLIFNRFENSEQLVERIALDADFFEMFLKEITVNTTEAFRDPTLWLLIREEILPLFENKTEINIWHAGCSIGLEVYSMCILLKELNLLDKTKIMATDINADVLNVAKSGKYSISNLNHIENSYLFSGGKNGEFSYIEKNEKHLFFDLNLIKNCTFNKFDLTKDIPFDRFDLIICRNVLIYFDEFLQERVFEIFQHSLKNEGILILGKTESLTWSKQFKNFEILNGPEKVYRLIN